MQTDLLDIRNVDCMKLMAEYPDNYFDLAVVDPPYGIGCDGKGMSGRSSKSKRYKNFKGSTYKGGAWDKNPPQKPYFKEVKRVSKNQIVWGANHFISKLPFDSPCWLVWYKKQNPNDNAADCEIAWTSFKTAVRFINIPWSGFGHLNLKEKRIHPTQKPVKLYDWIFANYAEKGQKILDTHMGSGSIAIAAHYAGMNLTACELDEDYFKAACERIEKETRQLDFFEAAAVQESVAVEAFLEI